MPTNGVAGILLAAGTSTRMGRNKMLLDLGGETVLRRAARCAIAGGLGPMIVVLGAEAERAEKELGGLECEIVMNPQFESGMTSSMQCGLAALPTTAAAAMILLADMPFVTADMISAQQALELGLVNYVVPSEGLIAKCVELMNVIKTKSPAAIASVINAANGYDGTKQGFENELTEFGKCFTTEDIKEGINAFIEKRKPQFAR